MLRSPIVSLYPPLTPNRSGWLDVGDGHSLYWEESGNPQGRPVLVLHGGPGAGCNPVQRRFFDPQAYRIILFDQRGAGRSQPYAGLINNTTQALLDDIEHLRTFLQIDQWLLFGGSWGSTLALAYGQMHPDRCLGFILRGIFLFTDAEVDWFMHGMGRFYPEAEHALLTLLPEEERATPLASYYRRLCDPDPQVHLPAAAVWCYYEEICCCLIPDQISPPSLPDIHGQASLAMARIEAHYLLHRGFLDEGQLLANMHRIRHLPAILVQGRYDIICPPLAAVQLAAAWPAADLLMIPDAGHSALEPGICSALQHATNDFRHL